MKKKFIPPVFSTRDIELRFESGEICIYGSEKGLKKLIDLCQTLIDSPQKSHIHLEDFEVLTAESLRGTIAIFPRS